MLNNVQNRKLKLAIAASGLIAIQVFLRHAFDIDISVEEMLAVVSPLLSFIGVEGVADMLERYKQGSNGE